MNCASRVVSVVREFTVNVTSGTFKVTCTSNNGIHALESLVRVRSFKGKVTGTSVEIVIGALAQPNFSLVQARAHFKVASDLVSIYLVVDGTRKGPRLPRLNRRLGRIINFGSVRFNDGLRPFLQSQTNNKKSIEFVVPSLNVLRQNAIDTYLDSSEHHITTDRLLRSDG